MDKNAAVELQDGPTILPVTRKLAEVTTEEARIRF